MQHQVYDTLYTGVCFSYSKSKRSIMDDDEVPQLSSHTLAALQEFYTEQSQQQQKLIDTQEGQVKDVELSEDWVCIIISRGTGTAYPLGST